MDKIIDNVRYLVLPSNEKILLRIPKNSSAEQLTVSRTRLEGNASHPGEAYPAELQRELARFNLRLPKKKKNNKKKKKPAHEPPVLPPPASPPRHALQPPATPRSPSPYRARSRSPIRAAVKIPLEWAGPREAMHVTLPQSPVSVRSPYPLSRPIDTREEQAEPEDYGVFEALPVASEPGPSANGMLHTF